MATHSLGERGPPLDRYDKGRVQFGPTITAEVLTEEHPVQALLDMGSPILMVSMKFLLRVLLVQTGQRRN